MAQKHKRVVLGVCGSIAAYKAADIIRRLQEHDCQVSVVMTKEAAEFITPLTLGTLSGQKVLSDMFADEAWRMGHIELARQMDVFLIAPATANMIAKLAHGMADDMVSTLALTTKSPIYVAPAMNDDMYAHVNVSANCASLKKQGIKFIEPQKGKLACGVVGLGHLAEIDDIVKAVLKA